LAAELVKELIDAGVHFGHRVSRWNPKMKPYIFGKRNLIHIINIKETLKGMLLAKRFLTRVVAEGKDVLFVGTKRQARKALEAHVMPLNMHYVEDRWLGGTLTNFREIRKRVGRLDHLENLDTQGQMDLYSKKEGSSLRREMRKIQRNLGGIRRMERLPGAMVVIDQRREINCIREANKMGIPVICLLDTDCDPDLVDIPIPGNDDAMRAIEIIIRELATAVREGMANRVETAPAEGQPEGEAPRRRRAVAPRSDRLNEAADSATPASGTPTAPSHEMPAQQ
jgi:small subunit ribosomal protein S2